jgi:hypothetical protein
MSNGKHKSTRHGKIEKDGNQKEKRMKTTTELITDLNAAQKKSGGALLIVGFPTTTRVLMSDLFQPLQLLETLLQQGGIPVGIVNMMETTEDGHFAYSVFEEHVGNGWAESYMKAFATKMAERKRGEVITESIGIDEFRSTISGSTEAH